MFLWLITTSQDRLIPITQMSKPRLRDRMLLPDASKANKLSQILWLPKLLEIPLAALSFSIMDPRQALKGQWCGFPTQVGTRAGRDPSWSQDVP